MEVNSVDIYTPPPIEPSSIEDILPDNIPASDRRAIYSTLVPFQSVFTWADKPIGRTNTVQQNERQLPLTLCRLHAPKRSHRQRFLTLSPYGRPHILYGREEILHHPRPVLQIEVHSEDRAKTAFSLTSSFFEFTTLPMGLATSAATCQRVMKKILQNLCPSKCLVYLDDVIVCGTTVTELLDNLAKVLTRYQDAGLTLNPRKCKFIQTEIRFPGHIVRSEGLRSDPEKIQAVKDWQQTANGEKLRSFLGLVCYYRSFISSYARLAFPITRPAEKSRPFWWTSECERAFAHLKEALTAASILCFRELRCNGSRLSSIPTLAAMRSEECCHRQTPMAENRGSSMAAVHSIKRNGITVLPTVRCLP
uniref:Retrovirus-related Pol polyprotein from transposon 297 n=1 Tax=Schistocephalus solidus TaxID=70667 RepID=A0A0V0J631_SCHSO